MEARRRVRSVRSASRSEEDDDNEEEGKGERGLDVRADRQCRAVAGALPVAEDGRESEGDDKEGSEGSQGRKGNKGGEAAQREVNEIGASLDVRADHLNPIA